MGNTGEKRVMTLGITKRHATDQLREAEDMREIYVCIDTDRLREAEEPRLREAEGHG